MFWFYRKDSKIIFNISEKLLEKLKDLEVKRTLTVELFTFIAILSEKLTELNRTFDVEESSIYIGRTIANCILKIDNQPIAIEISYISPIVSQFRVIDEENNFAKDKRKSFDQKYDAIDYITNIIGGTNNG